MLIIVALAMPARTMVFTMGIGMLRGGGDVKMLMLIDIGTLYLIALPMAAITGLVFKLGIAVVYSSILADDFTKAFLLFLRVRTKKWINDITREKIE
jgi:Na+-driven multidrug efflux pump